MVGGSFNRRISVGNSPSYFFFRFKYVAWLITALRQMSANGAPWAPYLRVNAFWASENFEAVMVFRFAQPRSSIAEDST